MTSDSSASSTLTWARLVPEFLVTDIEKSLRFWRDLCGFTVLFDRPDEGFAYLDLGGAQIMLDERSFFWLFCCFCSAVAVSITALRTITMAEASAWCC